MSNGVVPKFKDDLNKPRTTNKKSNIKKKVPDSWGALYLSVSSSVPGAPKARIGAWKRAIICDCIGERSKGESQNVNDLVERKGRRKKRKRGVAYGSNTSSISSVGERHCRELSGIDTRGAEKRMPS